MKAQRIFLGARHYWGPRMEEKKTVFHLPLLTYLEGRGKQNSRYEPVEVLSHSHNSFLQSNFILFYFIKSLPRRGSSKRSGPSTACLTISPAWDSQIFKWLPLCLNSGPTLEVPCGMYKIPLPSDFCVRVKLIFNVQESF